MAMIKTAIIVFIITVIPLFISCKSPIEISNIELIAENSTEEGSFYIEDRVLLFKVHFTRTVSDADCSFQCDYIEGKDSDLLSNTSIASGENQLINVSNWEISLSRSGLFWPRGSYQLIIFREGKEISRIPFQITSPPPSCAATRQTDPLPTASKLQIGIWFNWQYNGQDFRFEMTMPSPLYDYYFYKPRFPMRTYNDYLIYATDPFDDKFVDLLATLFNQQSEKLGLNQVKKIEFVNSFIQSLPYIDDRIAYGYERPKYPVETLIDRGGDCEDTSILLSSILSSMNITNVLLFYPTHVAVGLELPGEQPAKAFKNNGNNYYYVESVSPSPIGEIPIKLVDMTPIIVPLVPKAVIVHNMKHVELGKVVKVTVEVINLGSEISKPIKVHAGFETDSPDHNYYQESDSFKLGVNQSADIVFYLNFPFQNQNRLVVNSYHDSQLSYTTNSTWNTIQP